MNRSMADRAADILSGVMLPLASSTMPRLTGTRSLLKCVTSCRSPSSNTAKSSLRSPEMNRPSSSVTVVVTLISSTPPRKLNPSWFWGAGRRDGHHGKQRGEERTRVFSHRSSVRGDLKVSADRCLPHR